MKDPYTLIADFGIVQVWHRDKGGCDGACGWSYPHLTDQQRRACKDLGFWEGSERHYLRYPFKEYRADVREMKTSAGSDFYVCVQVGSRYLTPSKYREKWQADFDAAEWNALFTGGERPDVLAFGPPAALEAE